jgi:predicted PurR-regulated permease PerM
VAYLDSSQRRSLRLVIVLAGYALLAYLLLMVLWQVRSILPPFFVAFVIAIALAPVVDRLETRGWPRALAAAAVYLGLFAALGALLFVLVPLVAGQIGQIAGDLRGKFRLDQPADLTRTVTEHIRVFGRQHEIPPWIVQPVLHQVKGSAVLLTTGLERFGSFLLRLIPSLIWVVLVPIVAFYALVDYHRIFAKLLLMVPKTSRETMREIASEVTVVFGKYLRGLGVVCLLDTVATIVVLYLFPPTRPYAAALGLIAGILYAVPYIGALVSTGLISLVALVSPEGGSPGMMLAVTAAMVALHQLFFDQVLAPRILGGHVGLHPILSILALLAGDQLFGIGGMLLAVPVAASIQVIVLHIVPRLARRIDVHLQEEQPSIGETVQDSHDRLEPVVVSAGEGVVTTPRRASEAP